ncbi:ferritin-like domain-containing protein [Planotetraspora kaengkrachanensis]|uniref:DUF4439 domain-containing protein n=1 Tax=Planotetraspora kaengkrachanensis TaxID=575193 RepID=A0A8J3PSD0_9ACTN|nr:ferritin-like domain-containing protein [Planotetraspora kaengkrachanensis]GIG79309.1 hypothetical protein Pka01_24360 [Planotetraspora kaengkrachanensis]
MADPLAKALAAEHAAVYAYGVIGAKTTGKLRARATTSFDAHRARRDQLRALINQRGVEPAEPAPTYRLPFEVTTSSDAVRLAVVVEQRLVTAYLELAADADAAVRRVAALAAQESATRAYGWQPAVTAFPGMPGQTASPAQPDGAGEETDDTTGDTTDEATDGTGDTSATTETIDPTPIASEPVAAQ